MITFSADTPWNVEARRVTEIVESRDDAIADIRAGGRSPLGDVDAISGPLDQHALIATLIDPQLDWNGARA